jgi:oligosaccharide repeat unit polymerase
MSAGHPGSRRASTRSLARHSNVVGAFLFGMVSLWLLGAVAYWPALGSFDPGVAAICAFSLFFLHVLLVHRRISAVDPVVWLPVSFLCFYFGMPVSMGVFGNTQGWDAWGIGLPRNFDRGFALALLTLSSFLWGMHLGGFSDLSGGPKALVRRDDSLVVPAWLMCLGALGMVAVGVAIVGPSVVFGYYSEWWGAKKAGADARFVDMGLILAGAGVFALLASHDSRRPLRLYFALATSLALVLIFVQKGSRGGLISFGIGASWCFSQRVRRIPILPLLAVASLAILVLPALREYRTTKRIEAAKTLSAQELAGHAFREMGGSVTVFGHTLDLVPARDDYIYGMSFVRAVVDAIPNVGLTKGKSFSIKKLEYSPSAWLTWQLNPAFFASGGGYGFAMGAELFYNFSFPGVLMGAAFLGWMTVRIRNAAYESALALVASALFMAAMATYVRNVIGAPLRAALWPVVGLFLLRALVRALGRRSGRRTAQLGLSKELGLGRPEPDREGARG